MNISVYKLHKLNNSPKIFCNEGKKFDVDERNVTCSSRVISVCVHEKDTKKEEDMVTKNKNYGNVFIYKYLCIWSLCAELISGMLVGWFVGLCNAYTQTHAHISGI